MTLYRWNVSTGMPSRRSCDPAGLILHPTSAATRTIYTYIFLDLLHILISWISFLDSLSLEFSATNVHTTRTSTYVSSAAKIRDTPSAARTKL